MTEIRCPRCETKLAEVEGELVKAVWGPLRVTAVLPVVITCRCCGHVTAVVAPCKTGAEQAYGQIR